MAKSICAGVVLTYKDKILICRSTKSQMFDGSEVWGFPKGHQDAEDDNNTLNTALRELEEETGVSKAHLNFNNIWNKLSYSTNRKKITMYFIEVDYTVYTFPFICKSIVKGRDYPEIDKFIWVTLEESHKYIKNHMRYVINNFPDNKII